MSAERIGKQCGVEPAHSGPSREEPLVVGVGFRPGTSAEAILRAVRELVGDAECRCLATLDRRADEAGLRAAARELAAPVLTFPAALLATVPVPHPSERVAAVTGAGSVAEAAAVLAAKGGELVRVKTIVAGVTVAAARPQRLDG